MKKTLLLSIVASTMIMAGGDIAPVEPAVVTPAPVVESNWKFSGQGVVYYQTQEGVAVGPLFTGDLFDQENSFANAGLQLTATNSDLIAGIGFGVQLNGIGTLGLEEDVVIAPMQNASHYNFAGPNNDLNGAYFSQLYLTYGMGNTSLKVGRQELPKALSPFAYSEDWNVFTNTFDAALIVNTDIQDTVLVGAWVREANQNGYAAWDILTGNVIPAGDMNDFRKLNDDSGVFMLTAQNKSITDLTLTGSWYYANDFQVNRTPIVTNEDLHILWADAQYNMGFANLGLQGGTIMNDALAENTNAFGAKLSGKLDIVNAHVAYSHINDSSLGMFQVGGSGSTLYTDMLTEEIIPYYASALGMNFRNNNDKFTVAANADVLGGNLGGAYGYTDYDNGDTTNEFDLAYSTNITENTKLTAAYAYVDADALADSVNIIRLVGRYNF